MDMYSQISIHMINVGLASLASRDEVEREYVVGVYFVKLTSYSGDSPQLKRMKFSNVHVLRTLHAISRPQIFCICI